MAARQIPGWSRHDPWVVESLSVTSDGATSIATREPTIRLSLSVWLSLTATIFLVAAGFYELQNMGKHNMRAITANSAAIQRLSDAMNQLVAHNERLKHVEQAINEIRESHRRHIENDRIHAHFPSIAARQLVGLRKTSVTLLLVEGL